jgi:type VI secretion system protein ImpH
VNALASGWRGERSAVEWLHDEPFRFEFDQAVRLLELIRKSSTLDGRSDGSAESDAPVRFHSRVTFEFAASEVHAIAPPTPDGQHMPTLTVNFMSLAGVGCPLPYAYTEMILKAAFQRDCAAIDFLDIFNHRLIWMFYRAHKMHRPTLTVNAPSSGETAQYLFSLIGLGPNSLRGRSGVSDGSLLHYSGLLSRSVRSTAGLECMLADYFGVPVRLQQFAGAWRELDRPQQTTLGFIGLNQTLGDSAVLGKRVWDQAAGVVLEIGPLDLPRFISFLPGEEAHGILVQLARFYLGLTFQLQIRLRLKQGQKPSAVLSSSRLGYTAWMGRTESQAGGAAIHFAVKA